MEMPNTEKVNEKDTQHSTISVGRSWEFIERGGGGAKRDFELFNYRKNFAFGNYSI